MKPFPTLPCLLFASGAVLAAAQETPRVHPAQASRVQAALDDCWADTGGRTDDPDDGVDADLMDLCMADKGFDPPGGPPPGPDGGPPLRRSLP
ncbi:MAG TPA: hypothetical protein VM621_00130 [Luteibacter sp.]|uniref:hypothetical protein n=1 Tax=Luteibacter sp. TaxID=1886636 RepID=UPI002B76C9B2|nr:hypothetical protein [Luteibacter sp.]HVI53441.1 hypothetical protein [Luteibacter sp.]